MPGPTFPKKIRFKNVPRAKAAKGLTKAELKELPPTIKVPENPTYPPYEHGNKHSEEFEEQQVLRVEIMLVKGIRDRRTLANLLEIKDLKTVDRYISRVHARWEMGGSQQDHARNRGEGLKRLDLIESELWSRLQNQEDARVAAVLLNSLLQVQDRRNEMLGLTPKVIERIGSLEAEGVTFSRQAVAHERLTMFAQRMMALIEDREKIRLIEGKANGTPNEEDAG